VKYFDWNTEKNDLLKRERGISFEDIQRAIQEEDVLDIIDNPNTQKYSKQKIFVVLVNNYVYMVPYVEDDEKYFLKTIFASRKMTKKYLKGDEKA
jgi:uncharacterized DUF497 family protein